MHASKHIYTGVDNEFASRTKMTPNIVPSQQESSRSDYIKGVTSRDKRQLFSRAAVTHKFRKLKTPSKCRECDSYVYFQGKTSIRKQLNPKRGMIITLKYRTNSLIHIVSFNSGYECHDCGLSSHKKCLETLALQCGHKRLPRRMTTFGVRLSDHLQETGAQVPPLVCKCVHNIEAMGGIKVKGKLDSILKIGRNFCKLNL